MKLLRSLLIVALTLGVTSVFGQEKRIKEEGKIEFNPHWFMQIQGGAAHTVGENKFSKLLSPSAALNFGYKFTPTFGLRFGVSGWQGKGSWVNPREDYKFKFIQGNVDLMFDLCNLFGEFNHERTLNPYLFLGGGVNYGFDNDEAVAIAGKGYEFEHLWKDNKTFIAGRGGVGLNIRLGDIVGLNIEGNANILSDKFNSKKGKNIDYQFNGLIGLHVKFKKGYIKTEPVYYEDPIPTAPARIVPKEEPRPVVKEEKVEAMTQNIFFKINSSVIETAQQSKITDLAEYLKKYPEAKVTITGYADKKTGNPPYNLRLSKARAAKVAEALKAKGIAADRITTDAKGDTVQPFTVNEENRVSICITK